MKGLLIVALVASAACPARAAADDVTWNEDEWGTFGTAELAALAFLAAGTALTRLHLAPGEPWRGGNVLDDALREGLRLESPDARSAFATASDVLLVSSMAWPFADAAGNSIAGGDPRVSEQISLISALTYSATWFLNTLVKNGAARERPWGTECEGDLGPSCGSPDRYRSFYSGHAALSFTGAALVCTHHANLGLYGDPALDAAACGVSLALATASSLFRIMADGHYFTDVLMGAVMGALAGVLIPTALHYGF